MEMFLVGNVVNGNGNNVSNLIVKFLYMGNDESILFVIFIVIEVIN